MITARSGAGYAMERTELSKRDSRRQHVVPEYRAEDVTCPESQSSAPWHGAGPSGSASATAEKNTTRDTKLCFAIIAAFAPPCEAPATATCDQFGLPSARKSAQPSSGNCLPKYSSNLVSRLTTLFVTLTLTIEFGQGWAAQP